MRKSIVLLCVAIAWIVASAMIAEPAHAIPEFKRQFEVKYIGDAKTVDQKKISEAVKTAKCNLCHNPGPGAKVRNEYGKALEKLITKKDKKDAAKIQKALKTVEAEKSSDGKTFGEKLAAGDLPAAK